MLLKILFQLNWQYWHSKIIDSPDEQVIRIKTILKDFKDRFIKIEKNIAYFQERYHYFETPNVASQLSEKNKKELSDTKDVFLKLINVFLENIKRFRKSKSLDVYLEVKESYNQIAITTLDIFKVISTPLNELKAESVYDLIKKNLWININENQNEESKGKEDEETEPIDIFNKKIDFITSDYLLTKTVNDLQSDVNTLCNWADKYYHRYKDKKKVNVFT